MKRRKFINNTFIATSGILLAPSFGFDISRAESGNFFGLPDLPYSYTALEPFIDEQTMRIHHGKHFQGYTNKLNKAIENTGYARESIENILKKVAPAETSIRNNGGGYYNHALFFESLSPEPKAKPQGALMASLENDFGSFEGFVEAFSTNAKSVFGSGWAWLIQNQNGSLSIGTTSNQDNPLMSFTDDSGFPLMAIDVWEHAYYLNYQNRRDEYIQAFFKVLNWEYVENRYNNHSKQ